MVFISFLRADMENSGADIVGACNHEGDKECIGDWDLFYKYSTTPLLTVGHSKIIFAAHAQE